MIIIFRNFRRNTSSKKTMLWPIFVPTRSNLGNQRYFFLPIFFLPNFSAKIF
jgi:hypothetical protein